MANSSPRVSNANPLQSGPEAGGPERSAVLLELAAEIAHFGGWEVLLPERVVWWSDQVYAMFEIPLGTPVSVDATVALCAPEYRATLRALFEACAGDGKDYDTNIEAITASGRRIWVRTVGRAIRAADASIVRIQGAVQDTSQEKAREADAAKAARRLGHTLETMTDAFFTLGPDMRFTYLNREAERMLQRSRRELLGKYIWDEFREAIGGPSYREYGRAMRECVMVAFEENYAPLGRWFEVRGYPSEDGLAVYFHDITEAKHARASLQQAHRALQMLSRCNHVLVHAENERQLVEQVCQIVVGIGGYRMAWVGYVVPGPAPSITIAARAGSESDAAYLEEMSLSWSAAGSPIGQAVSSGEAVVIGDLATDTRFRAHMGSALARGFHGAVFLPMYDSEQPSALLALYSGQQIDIDAGELQLLQELANNIWFGIQGMRARVLQEQLNSALSRVAASVSSAAGESFFEQLVATMVQSVGGDGGFITRMLPGTDPARARTVVALMNGSRIADFEYVVGETPCWPALEEGHCVIETGLGRRYPKSPSAAVGADAYVGWRMNASDGAALGTAVVVFLQPLERAGFVTSTLRIFAARAAAELELQDADAKMRAQGALLDQAQDGIIVRDLEDRVIFWNRGAERMYGWTRDEALGRPLYELLSDELSTFREAKRQVLDTGHWQGEITRQRKDGMHTTVEVRLSLIKHATGAVEAILSISTDVSRRRAAEREIERLAFYDPVTALPNRLLLQDRLEHALAMCARSGDRGALLFIDIDHFKHINDTVGHQKGDQLLAAIAARLRDCMAGGDTLARFGGDEFMVLVEKLSHDQHDAARQATAICQTILDRVRQPIRIDGQDRHITASIGVTLFSGHQDDIEELLKQTDMALYQVKAAGRNGMQFFDPAMQREIAARASIDAELREACALNEFQLYYQPQVDQHGCVVGAEALLRWNSARRGAIPPSTFIPIAEENGQIDAIGRWVLETACAQLARWEGQAGLGRLCISVNVSARQLARASFVSELLSVVKDSGADPCKLKLEITESMLVENSETTIAKMHELRAHGLGFSLDDFGTGYSSLNYLKRMPLDQLKIDQSFVRDVLDDPNDAAIACTIIELARNLKMKIIAEGVETAGQRDFLVRHGCGEFQGYFFCRPVPVAEFEAFVRSGPTVGPDCPSTPG